MSDGLFDAVQRGCLDELEKIGSAHGLSETEKVAIMGTVGKVLAKALTQGGRTVARQGSHLESKGVMGIGKKLQQLGGKAMEHPEVTGALGIGVPAALAAGGVGGAALSRR